MNYKLWKHQKITTDFYAKNKRTFDTSDPGTGKTLSVIHDIDIDQGKVLILCPKSLIDTVWADDIAKYRPELSTSSCYAKDRTLKFSHAAHVYITNIDAATWLGKQKPSFFKGFHTLIIDESTAYKHNRSARSKAVNKIKKHFETRRLLTGTPHAGNISDIWNQMFIVDDGAIFGPSFTRFRQQTMDATQVGPMPNMIKWKNKPDIEEVVAAMMRPVNVRHKFEDCISIPEDFKYVENYYLTPAQQKAYLTMKDSALASLASGDVSAINAAALTTKLLQIASGAVYGDKHSTHLVDTGRYDLIIDLIKQRDHTVCFFNWRHQREQLCLLAEKAGISHCFIDGTVSDKQRLDHVRRFQNGEYEVIFLHPQSAAHGLTFTTANTTIWTSPTYMGDVFLQGNARVRRAGQKRRTETILVQAVGTIEANVYTALESKLSSIEMLQQALET